MPWFGLKAGDPVTQGEAIGSIDLSGKTNIKAIYTYYVYLQAEAQSNMWMKAYEKVRISVILIFQRNQITGQSLVDDLLKPGLGFVR